MSSEWGDSWDFSNTDYPALPRAFTAKKVAKKRKHKELFISDEQLLKPVDLAGAIRAANGFSIAKQQHAGQRGSSTPQTPTSNGGAPTKQQQQQQQDQKKQKKQKKQQQDDPTPVQGPDSTAKQQPTALKPQASSPSPAPAGHPATKKPKAALAEGQRQEKQQQQQQQQQQKQQQQQAAGAGSDHGDKQKKKKEKKKAREQQQQQQQEQQAAGAGSDHGDKQKKKKEKKKAREQQQQQQQAVGRHPPVAAVSAGAAAGHPAGGGGSGLLHKMRAKLAGGRFRQLNEAMYTRPGAEAFHMMQREPELFEQYHQGFKAQVAGWPLQPQDVAIAWVKQLPRSAVVADFGCGDARLAASVPQVVRSLDLVASSPAVIACNMASTPLAAASCDAAVFSLALMGTDYGAFLAEAARVLRPQGRLWIAEVRSRFSSQDDDGSSSGGGGTMKRFILCLKQLGFKLRQLDADNKMFVILVLDKLGQPRTDPLQISWPALGACVYKKR